MEWIRAAGDCSFVLFKPSRTETPPIEILLSDSGGDAIIFLRHMSGGGGTLGEVVAENNPDEENQNQERGVKFPPSCESGAVAHCRKITHREKLKGLF